MTRIRFYAARDDLIHVLTYLYSENVRVFEAYSEYDRPLREFPTLQDLDNTFRLGKDRYGNQSTFLALRPVGLARSRIRRFKLNPNTGGQWRESTEGSGLLWLYIGGVYKRFISQTEITVNTEARAQKWGITGGTDWNSVTKLASRSRSRIRRMGVAKAGGAVVLPHAYRLAQAGYHVVPKAGVAKAYWPRVEPL